VIKFARATGDLQTLSDVDLKLIALTYTLEAQIHGNKHIRDCPPPVHVVNAKTLHEKDMPGWGSNVPNLKEWEAIEHAVGDGSDPSNSRILPLQDLNMNIVGDGNDEKSEDGSKASSEIHEDVVEGNRRRYLPKKREVKIEGKKMVADGIDASQGNLMMMPVIGGRLLVGVLIDGILGGNLSVNIMRHWLKRMLRRMTMTMLLLRIQTDWKMGFQKRVR